MHVSIKYPSWTGYFITTSVIEHSGHLLTLDSFMECLLPYVDQPIFSTSFDLATGGFIDFGYSDNNAWEGDLTVLPIVNDTSANPALWVTQGVHFGAGGKFFNAPPLDIQFDTASPWLNMPAQAAAAYFKLVPGSSYSNSTGLWQYKCSSPLPDLDIIFSDITSGPSTVSIPGSSLKNGAGSQGTCTTYILNADGLGNIGLPFYVSKYMIWNQAKPSISFARRKGVAAPKSSASSSSTSTHPKKTSSATSTSSGPTKTAGSGTTGGAKSTQTGSNQAGSVSVAAHAGIGFGVAVWAFLFTGL